ncbi:MAG: hypothetical protein AB1679_28245 [Actinomycetota bacterium]|jgi:predicted small secreted protein
MSLPSELIPTRRRTGLPRRSRALIGVFAAVSVLGAACSSGGGRDVQQAATSKEDAPAPQKVHDVLPDPSITLTDDTVVVRSAGGRAVRRFDDDPDTIVIDAGAEGADQLDPGEIMLLTGVTVVRAAKVDKVGDELRITGAPVSLPEVIKNGSLKWDAQPIDMSNARLTVWAGEPAGATDGQSAPPAAPAGAGGGGIGIPGGLGRPGGARPPMPGGVGTTGQGDAPAEDVPSDEQVEDMWGDVNDVLGGGDGSDLFGLGADVIDLERAGARLASSVEELTADSGPGSSSTTTTAPPAIERAAKMTVDGVEYGFSYVRQEKEKLDIFKLSVESASGPEKKQEVAGADGPEEGDTIAATKVKGTLETEVKVKNMMHQGDMEIVDGVVRKLELVIPEMSGEVNVSAKFQALSMVANMVSDPLFDLPLSLEVPVVLGGIPFTMGIKVGVQVNLSMAMLDNTLSGLAKVTFGGDSGFRYADGAISVFGKRIQNGEDLLNSVKGLAEGPVGLVFTNELPKLSFGLGYKLVTAGVFLSNGYVASFHILPSPAPCTAANVSYVLAGGATAKFFGVDFEYARKAITEQRWHFNFPKDQRCNAEPG